MAPRDKTVLIMPQIKYVMGKIFMERLIKSVTAVIFTGLLALQPLSFAGPLVVMADELVESGTYEEPVDPYNPDADLVKYDWKIYKCDDGLKLLVEGKEDGYGVFNGNSLTEGEGEEVPVRLLNSSNNSISKTRVCDVDIFEMKGMDYLYDDVFNDPTADENYMLNYRLKKIIIDENLEDINHSQEFTSLDSVVIDRKNQNLKSDGRSVLKKNGSSFSTLIWYLPNGETEYSVKEGITEIAGCAFYFARDLTAIKLPSTLKTIRHDAFWGCENIKKIDIPASVTRLDDGDEEGDAQLNVSAFLDMDSLEEINVDPGNKVFSSEDGVLFSKDKKVLCHCPRHKKTDNGMYTVPSGVERLSRYAFYDSELEYILVPKSVKKIDYDSEGEDPGDKSYSSHVFEYAEGQILYEGTVEEWNELFDGNSSVYTDPDLGFPIIRFNCTDPDDFEKSIKEGEWKGFNWEITGNEGDYTLKATGTDEESEFNAIYNNKDDLYYLYDNSTGKFSFISLDKISHAEFKNLVVVRLFYFTGEDGENNNMLESVSFPKNATDLTPECSLNKLKTITLEKGSEYYSIQDGVLFYNNSESARAVQLYPAGLTASAYTLPDDVINIYSYAFSGNTSLKEIKLNEGLEYIYNNAFRGCTGLTSMELPSSFVPDDPENPARAFMFLGMPSLQKISVSEKNKYYSSVDGVLYSKDGKSLCFYPAARKDTDNCYRIPSNVETLGFYAFYGAQLDSVFIPKSVKEIEHETYDDGSCWYELFYGSNIKNIYYEGSKEEWDKLWNTEKCDPECKLPEIEYNSNGPHIIHVSDNLPMDYSTDERGDYKLSYNHSIPFFGKAKPQLAFFGEEGIKVLCNNEEYLASKVKINKNKKLITVMGLKKADGSDAEKDLIKAVKKATKGKNGLSFNINPYYIKDDTKLEPKKGKDGSLKSIKIEIKEKLYKAKKKEFSYDKESDTVTFDSENLKGSRKLS